MGDMYHTCRWCHSYTDGKCWQNFAESDSSVIDWIFEVAESGRLSEVLEESLNSVSRESFKWDLQLKLKEWKVSEKRIDEFIKLFDGCMGQFLDMLCKPICDENVSMLYQNIPEPKSGGLTIKDPDNFYCRYFE